MKKISYAITRNLKRGLIMASLVTGLLAMKSVQVATKTVLAVAPLTLVAKMKGKGIDLNADEEVSMNTLDEHVSELIKNGVSAESLKEAITAEVAKIKASLTPEQQTKFTELEEIVSKQAVMLEQLKSMGGKQALKDMTVAGQLKAWLEAPAADGKKSNKEMLEAFKKGEIQKITLEIKAAGTMTIAGNAADAAPFLPSPEIVPGYVDLVRNTPFIAQYLSSRPASRPSIVWVEKTNPQGNAAFIGEGVLKPLVDFDWKKNTSTAKKVADKIKVSTEMLDDIDFMAAAIADELKYLVDIKTDTELVSGDGIGDNLKGIQAYAGGYVLTTLKTDDPNLADVIKAAATQIKTLNFNANIAVVNPIDAANLQLTKGSTGYYVIPPFQSADGMTIAGIKVVESNQVAVGSLLVYDSARTNLRPYQNFQVSYGWVNDDFELNLVTIIGEQRLHFYIAENHTGAFVDDTIANIQAAIANATV